jgi:hypothetical protein
LLPLDMALVMTNRSVTLGWDAVCALALPDINALLLQQYADGGPVTLAKTIKFSATVDGQTVDLDLQLGPPLIVFGAGTQATVSMWVTSGTITVTGQGPAMTLRLAANSAQITGTVSLAAMHGSVKNGDDVGLDLTTGTFGIELTGLDPAAEAAAGTVIGQFFAASGIKYSLGTVIYSGDSKYPCLVPTSFSFGSQADDAGNQCLLIYITTSGTPGQAGPLAMYLDALPVGNGYSSALFLSCKDLFGGVLATQFGTLLASGGYESTAIWPDPQDEEPTTAYTITVAPSAGAVNAGPIGGVAYAPFLTEWSSQDAEGADVMIPASQLTIDTSNGLAGTWSSSWQQGIVVAGAGNQPDGRLYDVVDVALTLALEIGMSIEPGIDDGQQIALQVTAVTPQMTVNTDNSRYPDVMNSIFGDQDTYATIFNQFFGALSAPATGVFQFDLTPFSTFALNNLMFAGQASVLLQEADAPGDLVVLGTVQDCVVVTPPVTWVLPGQQVPLSAQAPDGQPVTWAIDPVNVGGIGIDTGLYTAPSADVVTENTVVVVTATASPTVAGTGVIIVAAPLVVNPSVVTLSASQQIGFCATQGTQVQPEADWTIDPQVGGIGPDGSYTAPDTVTGAQVITVTASLAGSVATATVQLQPSS